MGGERKRGSRDGGGGAGQRAEGRRQAGEIHHLDFECFFGAAATKKNNNKMGHVFNKFTFKKPKKKNNRLS